MNAISKESILSKTHYGLTIYSHILQQYYPDSIVLRLVERDCGLCRNPFNSNKKTLHIFIEKENVLGNVYDKEFARHADSENAIPAGDAFDFAELHYKQQGDELLKTLNKELHLRIGEQPNFYQNKSPICLKSPEKQTPCCPLFSFFKAPINNVKPHSQATLRKVYNAIKGDYYRERTQKLRAMLKVPSPMERAEGEVRKFKASNFDYCTFSGVFTTRNDKALIKHSGLMCFDFDNLQNPEQLRFQLLQDEYFDTQLLFRSPSGNGLKWIISVDTDCTGDPLCASKLNTPHAAFFAAVSNYISQTYGVTVDKSGKDISRACFLPHDPQAFINPKFV